MNQPLFYCALLSALLAFRPGVAQEVVQPTRPYPSPPQPPRPTYPSQPRPPRPRPQPQPVVQRPQPPRPPIQPPRPPASGWIPIATIAVRRPVGQAGAGLSGAAQNFRYLKLRVNNQALTLDHLLVSFDYGPAISLPLRYRLLAGRDSAPLSLQRLSGRRIRRVDLWYSSDGGYFNPVSVTILGLR